MSYVVMGVCGVGKTAGAVNLAWLAAEDGYRTLLVVFTVIDALLWRYSRVRMMRPLRPLLHDEFRGFSDVLEVKTV